MTQQSQNSLEAPAGPNAKATPVPWEPSSQTERFFPSDLELNRQQPGSPSETGFSFPLSFVLFLVTYAAVFFSLWRVSPTLALVAVVFSSPVWIRSIWVFERSYSLGMPLSFRDKLETVMGSVGLVLSASVCFAFTFSLLLAVFVFGSIGIGSLVHGESGISEGAILGTIAGIIVGTAGAIFITVWILQKLWPSRIRDDIALKGKTT